MLELFQPGCGTDFFLAFRAAARAGEEKSLFLDQLVVKRISMALVVPCPVGKGFLNIRDSPFGTFDGRSISIIRVEIFLFLA